MGSIGPRLRSARSTIVGVFAAARQGGAILLVVAVSALGLGADILQYLSSGNYWIWISFAAVAVLAFLILLFAGPILRRNVRGAWLFSALRRTALVDVEHRGDREHRLPPAVLFQAAGSQPILISGILDQLFQQNRDELVQFVEDGGRLRVLLIHPTKVADLLDRTWTRHQADWKQYWLTNCHEAQIALDGMVEAGLDRRPGFQLRFLTDIPPFFGMLVGTPDAGHWRAPRAFVRIQPLAMSMFVGRGSVLTFEQVPRNDCTPFAYYSADMNAQWDIAVEDPELVDRRRAALSGAGDGPPDAT